MQKNKAFSLIELLVLIAVIGVVAFFSLPAINDWINLAIRRAETTKYPTVFWLDQERSHDKQLIKVVKNQLRR